MYFGIVIVVAVIGGLLWFGQMGGKTVSTVSLTEAESVLDEARAVKDKLEQRAVERSPEALDKVTSEETDAAFARLYPLTIGNLVVQASLATTAADRTKGLSGTDVLPDGVVKLFVFDRPGSHGIWMKDMNYPIDIIWLNEKGEVIYFEERVSPATFPRTFTPPSPAKYVIETNAGFVGVESLAVGTKVILPPQAFASE